MPDTPTGWFERAGHRQAANATNLFSATGADTSKAVPGLVARGRRVGLFVDATLVDGLATKGSVFATANHGGYRIWTFPLSCSKIGRAHV